MGPVRDWGKKIVIVSGGTQYTLDGCIEWKSMGRLLKLELAFGEVAEKRVEMFEKNDGAIHQLQLNTEEGEAIEITVEGIKDCASKLVHSIVQGVAMQEVENKEIEVMKEVTGTEIRDII